MRHSPGRMAERESTLARARLSKLNTNRPARSTSTQASGLGDITSNLRDRWAEVGAQGLTAADLLAGLTVATVAMLMAT